MKVLETDLLDSLNEHDALVAAYVRGDIAWGEFDTAYNSFYPRYPLDGHESDGAELALLAKHAPRIELHRAIWEDVLTKMTTEEHAGSHGFIGAAEVRRRIHELARTYLGVIDG